MKPEWVDECSDYEKFYELGSSHPVDHLCLCPEGHYTPPTLGDLFVRDAMPEPITPEDLDYVRQSLGLPKENP